MKDSILGVLIVDGSPNALELYLDDPAVRATAESDPSAVVRHEGLLLIDEIQRVPELLLPKLTRNVTVPVSAGLLTDTEVYVRTLDAYRAGDLAPIVDRLSEARRGELPGDRQRSPTEVLAALDAFATRADRRTRG